MSARSVSPYSPLMTTAGRTFAARPKSTSHTSLRIGSGLAIVLFFSVQSGERLSGYYCRILRTPFSIIIVRLEAGCEKLRLFNCRKALELVQKGRNGLGHALSLLRGSGPFKHSRSHPTRTSGRRRQRSRCLPTLVRTADYTIGQFGDQGF